MASPVDILFGVPNVADVKAAVMSLVPIFDRMARAGKTAVERAAKDEVRAQVDATKQIGKEVERAAKDKERAAKAGEKAVERAAREAARAELNFLKAGQHAVADAEREKTRAVESESRKRTQERKNEDRAADALIKRRSRGFGSTMGGAVGRVMGTAGRAAAVLGAVGGGFTVADALRSGIQNEATAGQIVRSAQDKGGVTGHELEAKARATAIRTGGRSEDVLRGVDQFVQKTGSLKEAVNLLDELGLEAAASGAKIEDLGATSAEVFNALGSAAGTKDVMRMLIGQGKAGAVDIRNLAQYGGRLTSTAGLFEGDTATNIKSFGSLAQIAKAKGGATDAAEASEAAVRLFDEIATHKDKFEELGVKVKGGGGLLRNVEDILLDALVKSKGDITSIPKLFGRQAGKVETGLAKAFLEGSGGKTDKASLEAGRANAAALIQSFQRPVTQDELEADLKSRLAENDAKLNKATEELHAALNEKLLPKLPELIDKFTQLIPAIQRAVDFFTSGTIWEGVGKAVGIALGIELAKAGISMTVSAGFSALAAKILTLLGGGSAANAAATAATAALAGEGAVAAEAAAATAAGGAGAAGAGGWMAGLLGGAGVIGAGTLIPLAFNYAGNKREQKGADALAAIMAMPEDTEDEKKAKLTSLQGAERAGRASMQFQKLALRGQENELGNFPGGNSERLLGMDRQSAAAAKQMDVLATAAERLATALGQIQVATGKLPPIEPAGTPSGQHPNLPP